MVLTLAANVITSSCRLVKDDWAHQVGRSAAPMSDNGTEVLPRTLSGSRVAKNHKPPLFADDSCYAHTMTRKLNSFGIQRVNKLFLDSKGSRGNMSFHWQGVPAAAPTHPMMTWLALGSDAARSLMRSKIFVSPSPCTHHNGSEEQQAAQTYSVLAKGVDNSSSFVTAQRQCSMAQP